MDIAKLLDEYTETYRAVSACQFFGIKDESLIGIKDESLKSQFNSLEEKLIEAGIDLNMLEELKELSDYEEELITYNRGEELEGLKASILENI